MPKAPLFTRSERIAAIIAAMLLAVGVVAVALWQKAEQKAADAAVAATATATVADSVSAAQPADSLPLTEPGKSGQPGKSKRKRKPREQKVRKPKTPQSSPLERPSHPRDKAPR